jgi:hypothetical protein
LTIYAFVKQKTIVLETLGVKKTVAMTFAQQVYKVVMGKSTIATLGFGKALAVATGGITLILSAVVLLIGGISNLGKSSEKTSERVKQLQVDLYNLNQEEKDFSKLVDRFKELEKQAFKTSDELNEMATLLEKIKEAGGSEFDFVLAGTLDDDVIQKYMEVLEERRRQKIGELREEGELAIVEFKARDFNDGPSADRTYINIKNEEELTAEEKQAATEYIASLFEGFDEMSINAQEAIRDNIRKNLQDYLDKLVPNERSGFLNLSYELGIDEEASKMQMSEDLEDLVEDFEVLLTGMEDGVSAGSGRLSELLGEFFDLSPEDQDFLKSNYASQLGNILTLDEDTIRALVSKGFNINSINAMLANIEGSLGDLPNAARVTEFYADLLSGINPNDAKALEEIQNKTIEFIRRTASTTEEAEKAIKNFVGAVTDPMAFENAMNIFRQTSNSLNALLDASEAFAKGEIPENFEQLIRDYPKLADDIRNGTLDMEKAMEYVTDEAVADIKQKISDLRKQMAQEDDPALQAAFQAQIDTLEAMLKDPLFLFNAFAEESVKKIEDTYKTQIDFIKDLNAERQKEIDMMQKKIDMTKTMLDLDRQLAALSRDTSYGAQARARNLEEQQRAAAIEREKFVMDLITEQAISELEKKRDENVQSIKDNVEKIAVVLTDGANGGTGDTGLTIYSDNNFRIEGS